MSLPTNTLRYQRFHTGTLFFGVLYAGLIVHLSLHPYTDWRMIGIGPLEFLKGPWVPVHQKLLWNDIAINVLGYWPLGFILILAYRQKPSYPILFLAWLSCFALSLIMEGLQTWLPSRVPSKMDLLTNTCGAAFGVATAHYLRKRKDFSALINHKLEQWFTDQAWLGASLLALWFVCLLAPQSPSFSTLLWLGNFWDLFAISQGSTPFGISLDTMFLIEQYGQELVNTGVLLTAWLIGLAQTRAGAPRLRLLGVLITLTIALRLFELLSTTSPKAWPYVAQLWAESNLLVIIFAGAICVAIALVPLTTKTLARLSLACLLAAWGFTSLLPGVYDPEIEISGGTMVRVFRTLQEAGSWLSDLWPITAVIVLGYLSFTRRRSGR